MMIAGFVQAATGVLLLVIGRRVGGVQSKD
jgi:hypothetical protein